MPWLLALARKDIDRNSGCLSPMLPEDAARARAGAAPVPVDLPGTLTNTSGAFMDSEHV